MKYHCKLLDGMSLDGTVKVQIHVWGVYGSKLEAIDRFIKTYNNRMQSVDYSIKKRLVIENDDHLYSLRDSIYINKQTGIPILFDSFHHECHNNGESLKNALEVAMLTWNRTRDGLPMVDYSSPYVENHNNKNKKADMQNQLIQGYSKHS